ncbi:hypothetical protein [Planotetraspora silvatica]|uniref:hypothetical protein n=1 Tax=Planotetraspora silvatica TaxID=234614 RepID=UPI0031DBA638
MVVVPFLLLVSCVTVVATAVSNLPAAVTSPPTKQAAAATAPPTAVDETPAGDAATEEAADPTPAAKPEPKPKTYKGTGSRVVRIQRTDEIRLVTSTARGSGNFAVWSIGPDGDEQDLLANDIGSHKGTRLMNINGEETVALKVEADGPWTIAIKPVTTARQWSTTKAAGKGDDVLILNPSSSGFQTITSKFTGSGNFTVYGYDGDGNESLLANEIDRSTAENTLPDGTFLVRVEGMGAWTLARTGL